jgi:hypothetical protein
MTPRQGVEFECARRGTGQVVAGCIGLLSGQPADERLVVSLSVNPGLTGWILGTGRQEYWLRVWGARGLLYAWDDSQLAALEEALLEAMSDDHWRVREMAAKVIAKRKLGGALTAVAALQQDPVPRVRAAAGRAVAVLTSARS